ncbi:MAG: hypothetical protein ACI81L_002427 [Verrucomicrobiales bacterium]|jgi:hypothetical protein
MSKELVEHFYSSFAATDGEAMAGLLLGCSAGRPPHCRRKFEQPHSGTWRNTRRRRPDLGYSE